MKNIKKALALGIGISISSSMVSSVYKVSAAESLNNFTSRIQAEDFVSKTGNVYVRSNGEAVPVNSTGDDSITLTGAEGKFIDFSNPVDKYLSSDVVKNESNGPKESITGDTATWKVSVPYSGFYNLGFKYNNPATRTNGYRNVRDERNCRIVINDKDDNFLNEDTSWAGWMIFNISGYNKNYDANSNTSLTPQTDNSYKNVIGNTEWNNNYMNVYLDKGENVITLGIEAPPGQGVYDGPNLDYFDVSYVGNEYVDKSDVPYIDSNFKFQHPGIYYTIDDLENIKANKDSTDVNNIYKLGYDEIKKSKLSSATYVPHPQAIIDIGAYNNPSIGGTQYAQDGYAAHYNALSWYMDGDVANAKKAIEILNLWSSTLQTIGNGNDIKLRFSLIGPEFVNAAEILKNIYNNDPNVSEEDKWQQADIEKFESFLRDKLLSKTSEYYPQANGNWDALIGGFNMAVAVYLEDVDIFNDALTQFYLGNLKGGYVASMGSLSNYIYSTGESQESSRDQVHAQMGLTGLSYQSDIAWNQGIDLYDAYNNRLLTGAIYNAKYNLGNEVDSKTFISDKSRGAGAAVFEIVSNHYLNQITKNNANISYVKNAAETLTRKAGTKNEAGQPSSYYAAMIFNDVKYDVSLDLTADSNTLTKVGDKIIVAPKIDTISQIKDVNWHISDQLKPYINYLINENGQLEVELVKIPDSNFSADIIASTVKNASVSKTLTISYKSPSIEINKTDVIMNIGDSVELEANVYPENSKVEWTSSAQDIVEVQNGVIKAKKSGSAQITVKIENTDIQTVCTVKVLDNPEKQPVTITTDKNGNTVVEVSKIAVKDGKNSIEVRNESKDVTVEITDIEELRNDKGSLEIKSEKATISLPFSLIESNLLTDGSKVVFKFSIEDDNEITKNIKGIKKIFKFDLSVVNGEKVIAIDNFKEGLAEVTLTLIDDELEGLDKSKLAVFYYNEETKSFEVMDTKVEGNTITFTTSHFSKFIVAEKDSQNSNDASDGTTDAGNGNNTSNNSVVLPQTGGKIELGYLLLLGTLITAVGTIIVFRKRKVTYTK